VVDSPAVVDVVQSEPLDKSVMFPVPKAIVRVLALLELNAPIVSVNVLRLSVPLVSVSERDAVVVSALPSVHEPPTPLNVIFPDIITPFVVTVLPVVVALNVRLPVASHTVPASNDIEPLIAIVPVLVNVYVPAETVISRHSKAPVRVIVNVPAWSKKTLSAAVGTEAPDAPPDVADQTVVDVVFHVPVPPTQYLSATAYASGSGAGSSGVIGASMSAIQLSRRRCFSVAICSSVIGSSSGKIIASEYLPYFVSKKKSIFAILTS